MGDTLALRCGAGFGFLAVALGAFGAHGLKGLLSQNGTAAIWETAVFYHSVHAVLLVVLGMRSSIPRGPWISWALGIILFSGSLYLMAVTNQRWLGAITPLGGVSFLVGWAWLMIRPGTGARVS